MRKRLGILLLSLVIVAASALVYLPMTRPPTGPVSIPWERAIAVLQTGQVVYIFQSHHLEVSMRLKNGAVMVTKEPNIDDIFREIQKCGEPCKNIVTAEE